MAVGPVIVYSQPLNTDWPAASTGLATTPTT
jgi:hypothetical protein